MKSTFIFRSLMLPLVAGMIFQGCKREGCMDPTAVNYDLKAKKDDGSCIYGPVDYEIPSTYSFDNVNYSGQTQRLDMLQEMVSYMKTGNSAGTVLSSSKLKEMYANTGSHFSFSSTKQLKDKTFAPDQVLFDSYMDSLALASTSTSPASDGVAGILTSNSGANKYLVDANGRELTQIIEKGLMGAVFYYQVADNYLSEAKIGNGVDNETIAPVEGTPMEHHWDEAFGYFGVPVDFPSNQNGVRFYGKYSHSRHNLLGTDTLLMNAFIRGRAAISNKDYASRDKQVEIIRANWELVIASTAISYLNKAKADIGDDALRSHSLSEAVAFIQALKYSPVRKISLAEIDEVLSHIGHNFYQVTISGLDDARDQLSTIYELDHIKNTL